MSEEEKLEAFQLEARTMLEALCLQHGVDSFVLCAITGDTAGHVYSGGFISTLGLLHDTINDLNHKNHR